MISTAQDNIKAENNGTSWKIRVKYLMAENSPWWSNIILLSYWFLNQLISPYMAVKFHIQNYFNSKFPSSSNKDEV